MVLYEVRQGKTFAFRLVDAPRLGVFAEVSWGSSAESTGVTLRRANVVAIEAVLREWLQAHPEDEECDQCHVHLHGEKVHRMWCNEERK